jgi:hypothetical protein
MQLRFTAEPNRLDAIRAVIETFRPRMGFAAPHSKNRPADFRGMKDRKDPTVVDTTILRGHCHLASGCPVRF